eukprot:CAMPEP_0113859416 /NCGR_PEP_ID=MMETSP0372-20130328/12336_1 /TAXON_ID=340204 /ORGANISM="Lankesteria abbotti" /LENGTH=66 /DNA_ID=CAMNT_0000837639 /DNA_START=131 /DNA_END=328 /DNA_ORIENTATION=+ /assembly_acc=CAM_ASM_000359
MSGRHVEGAVEQFLLQQEQRVAAQMMSKNELVLDIEHHIDDPTAGRGPGVIDAMVHSVARKKKLQA